jgi:hypothetical protein
MTDPHLQIECKCCGRLFLARRKTAKFCSGLCRTRYHRMIAQDNLETPYLIALGQLRTVGQSVNNPDISHDTTSKLLTLKQMIDFYLPTPKTWWCCDVCGKTVQKQYPQDDCSCGLLAKWRIVNK